MKVCSREGLKHSSDTMPRPIPLPRRQISCPDQTGDDGAKGSKGGVASGPPVAPKNWTPKRGLSFEDARQEVAKALAERAAQGKCEAPPDDEVLDAKYLLDWKKDVTQWKNFCRDLKLRGTKEPKIIEAKALHLYKAVQLYVHLLSEHGDFLQGNIAELLSIADNLDKVSKGTKIAGITGGATTVAGGVAAAAGVILSPFTLGASLALTVVGVGVATAGGVTGASAAITNKVKVTQDRKKIEKIFRDHKDVMLKIESCLKFISEGMEQLQQHDLAALSRATAGSDRVAGVLRLAATGGGSSRAVDNSKASGMMEGLALGIDIHYIQGKDGVKLKTGHESKLAKKIRGLSEELRKGLEELRRLRGVYVKHCSV